jgi:hypothetical protein
MALAASPSRPPDAGPPGPAGATRARPGAPGRPLDAGALVETSNAALATLATSLDVSCLTGPDAASLYRSLCAGSRRVVALKALLASRIESSGWFRDAGFSSVPSLLASLEGTTDGEARRTLEAGRALATLPGVEEAARDGLLSAPKLAEVTQVASDHPEAEGELLNGIGSRSLPEVRRRSREVRNRHPEAEARRRVARMWHRRFFAHHVDAEGAFCFRGRDTPERGAALLAALGAEVDALEAEERPGADPEGPTPDPVPGARGTCSPGARRADALYGLVTGTGITTGARPAGGDGPAGPEGSTTPGEGTTTPRPPRCGTGTRPPATVLVRVDLAALRRGEVHPGEICEAAGVGPLPVPMARDLVDDALLRLIFHEADDIRAVVHHTRTINATLRTALEARDPTCVVPGCTMARTLEIDHVVPFVEGGPTSLENLARLCRHHHMAKTYEGWTLTRHDPGGGKAPTWSFRPPPPFGEEPDEDDDEGEGPRRE